MTTTHHNPSKVLRFAGDVNIDKCVITSSKGVFQDVSGQLLQIVIYEDIFSPFITGSLIIKDTLDLSNVFPLLGEEYLQLKVTTPTLQNVAIEGTFHVYKMSDKTKLGDRSVGYELNFISIESLIDTNKKVSKVYAGKISDIVGPFVTDKIDGLESTKKFLIENTRNTIKFISNFWSPVKNLTYCADNAISESQSPSFLFFENRDGFNFRSLEKLYAAPVTISFSYDRYTRDNFPLGGNSLNIMEDYKRIGTMDIPVSYDYMDRVRSGMLASKLVSYDSTKKTYTAKNYSAYKRFGSQGHLNKNPLFTDKAVARANSRMFIYPRAFETFTSFGDTTNARILQERTSFLKMAEAQKINISVPGRVDYTVGITVDVSVVQNRPVYKKDTQDDLKDKITSGKYLVSAINHTISPQGHDCTMELVKDSTIKEI
jgi:hypothetical protein